MKDPRVKDPRVKDPRVKDPRVKDPRVKDPRVRDPRVKDPRVRDPRVKDPRVKDLHANQSLLNALPVGDLDAMGSGPEPAGSIASEATRSFEDEYRWRAYSPARAIDELKRLASFTSFEPWMINIADPLFGFKRSWRREVLEGILREGLRPMQYWTLTRAEGLDRSLKGGLREQVSLLGPERRDHLLQWADRVQRAKRSAGEAEARRGGGGFQEKGRLRDSSIAAGSEPFFELPLGLHFRDSRDRLREAAVRRLLELGVLRSGNIVDALLEVSPITSSRTRRPRPCFRIVAGAARKGSPLPTCRSLCLRSRWRP